MLKSFFFTISVLVSSFFSVKAQGLKIGDDAPALHIIKWLKGKPVTSFEKGKVYIIEFTFVACKPCREAIPHLSEWSRKYREGGKVEVISVFTAESNPKEPQNLEYIKPIKSMVNYMANRMDYTVAIDVPKQETRKAWGDIFAYPSLFIVNQDGKIAYQMRNLEEMDLALESIVSTGHYDRQAFQQQLKERENISLRWEQFNSELLNLQEKGDYPARLSKIDSALVLASGKKKEDLLFAKFKTCLYMGDSVSADKYLQEVIANRYSDWETLHRFFYESSPEVNSGFVLPINYNRYLAIADSTVAEVGIPTMQAIKLWQKATVMYGYTHNKEEALAVLNQALKIFKLHGSPKMIEACELEIKKLEQRDKEVKAANIHWNQLMELMKYGGFPHPDSIEKAQKENGYTGYVLSMANHSQKILACAAEFWEKYPSDERRDQALKIYGRLHMYGMALWVSTTVSEERSADINALYTKMNEYYQQGQSQGKHIATGPPLFRMFPRDLRAATEWQDKLRIMLEKSLMSHNSILGKEVIEWTYFTNKWGQAAALWSELPDMNEHPDSKKEEVENDYWNLFSTQYWEGLWMLFNDHIIKYADYPVIADRALNFLGAMKGCRCSQEVVKLYWRRIIETYGNINHPLHDKAGIKSLCEQAAVNVNIEKVAAGEAPLDFTFTDMNGNEVNLKKLRGKVVLIDFWATWCKPCIASMPHLKQMYDKYKEKGFEVVGICLDAGLAGKEIMEGNLQQVQEALKKYNINWPQRYTGKGMGDPLAKLYSISALPTVWLLDKEGMLVSTNARGEELDRLLQRYIEN